MTTRIHDLLELPSTVRKGDFVQDLSGGIANPEQTVKDYALTPKLLDTFRHALSIVDSALESGRSQAAYLDGSFGAGKSHFMAVLDLVLQDDAAPWSRPELHALREQFPWIGKKRLLQLPIHMLGARDMESKVFGSYIQWLQEAYPDAPLPAIYLDDGLFEDAKATRKRMGDEAFFAELNGGVKQAASGWGKLGQARRWDAERFDAAVNSAYVGEADRDATSPRAQLFDDLVRTYFTAWAKQPGRFIDFDTGLGVLSRHAKGLGYDALVLYLDELILWLAGSSGDLSFVGREFMKMVKLKEAQDADRAIPIVSFIARQRDLSQFLGEQAQGVIRSELQRNAAHHEGRFESVSLADSNLPAIVRHRVVRPKNEAAAKVLEDDFARTWRAAGAAQSVLRGSEGDEEDFRRVYPFSPALVEALVALSSGLQRERTAIRILMELLVDHLQDLETGRVVPVGDVFDALFESADPIADPVMKARFDRARDLYHRSFLPLIRHHHQTDTPERCQRLREDHPQRLGCSGCQERACRNDNRLAKTLLMAALVPEAKPFKDLTIKRLVHLNHGTIASPIPGAEASVATARVREWASQIGAIRIGDQADAEIHVNLQGVDLKPILAQAANVDTPGARKVTLRKLLFKELGLEDAAVVDDDVVFYGTRRKGRVRFGNVREMDDAWLTCPPDLAWQVIFDYPFDEKGHGPDEDARRLERYLDARAPDAKPNPTVVWLPTFFSHGLERELGELVVLEHILDVDANAYLGHLRVEDQAITRADLASLRAQKTALIRRILTMAYGLTQSGDTPHLDRSRDVEEHLVPLIEGLDVRRLLAASLKDGLSQVVENVLIHRFPHHPRFEGNITVGRLEKVHVLLERLLEQPDRRMRIDRAEHKDLRGVADPLGLTETSEAAVVLREQPLKEIEQQRQQVGVATPDVRQVRGWLDVQGTRGLLREVEDVLISVYSTWSGRTLLQDGRAYAFSRPGQLPDHVELQRPELPSEQDWSTAISRAGALFGITVSGRTLGARNLSAFVSAVKDAVKKARVGSLVPSLSARISEWGKPESSHRLATAKDAEALLEQLSSVNGAALVEALARFTPSTSFQAMGRSLSTTVAVRRALDHASDWIVFGQVAGLKDDPQRGTKARELLEALEALLEADELNRQLTDGLAGLTRRASDILQSPAPTGPATPPKSSGEVMHLEERRELSDAKETAAHLRALADRIESGAEEGQRYVVQVTGWKKERGS